MGRWLVTSAWPYINHVPHLGTMIGSVLSADVVARYLRMKGEEVVFVSGSDEHGTPIEVEAIKEGKHPKELTDRNHAKIKDLFQRWKISFDNYTRTESPVHKEIVREILLKIYKNGYITTEETILPWCPRCQRFLPDRFVEGICPYCGYEGARGDQCDFCGRLLEPTKLIGLHCTICGAHPTLRKSKHWLFDLPKFSQKLLEYIENNRQLPDNARNATLKMIEEGLKPRPITRDNFWGIPAPFPGAEGKTVYVWIEAVLGYISATIEYFRDKDNPEGWRDYWVDPSTRTLYFVGKDNIPFHTIILPALLLASGEKYNLPWNVDSTEFLMFEGQKFSKSRRVGVWIDEALEMYPVDYWRYTLISSRPEAKDSNFTWDGFLEKVNSDLNDTLGNFIHRTLTFVDRYYSGRIPKPNRLDKEDEAVLQSIKKYSADVASYIERFRLQAAVGAVMELARLGNKYINDREPWKTIKTTPERTAATIYTSAQIVKALAVLLAPFMPSTAEYVWGLLGLPNSVHDQRWMSASEELPPNHRVMKPKPIFSKIELSEVRRKLEVGAVARDEGKMTVDELSKFSLKIGKIIDVNSVPGSTKLYKLTVDIGGSEHKTAVAGLKGNYSAEELRGRLVAVVTNIKPQKIFGVESEVMILAGEDDEKVALLQPDRQLKPGSKIY
ncbi:MAG: methionine--tRNA ligase [Candidatus Bathyarchaeia archaeon]